MYALVAGKPDLFLNEANSLTGIPYRLCRRQSSQSQPHEDKNTCNFKMTFMDVEFILNKVQTCKTIMKLFILHKFSFR